MRYGFIQRLMWTGFKGTFRKQLSKSFDERNPAEVIKNASKKYRKILSGVDEFEKGDHFLMIRYVEWEEMGETLRLVSYNKRYPDSVIPVSAVMAIAYVMAIVDIKTII